MSQANRYIEEALSKGRPSGSDVFRDRSGTEIDRDSMNHNFWVNDLLFRVPPESIVIQSEDTVWSWQSLRTTSSSKVHNGRASKIYAVKISIPHKGAIVNIDKRVQGYEDIQPLFGENTGKRGGFLDLLIQFKNIPFARIENAVIRSDLRVPKDKNIVMCMEQFSFSTEPNEPGLLQVNLVLSTFNYSPYSVDWAYKVDWRTSKELGSLGFEDVNPIELNGWTPYSLIETTELNYTPVEANMSLATLPRVERPLTLAESISIDEGQSVNIDYFDIRLTESDDALSGVETLYMRPSSSILNPSGSAVFKAYVDWLHSEWAKIPTEEGTIDCTRISPYGTGDQDLGDTISLSWNEYRKFEMDVEVTEELQRFVRRLTLEMSNGLRLSNPSVRTNALLAQSAAAPVAIDPDNTLGYVEVLENPVLQPGATAGFGAIRRSGSGGHRFHRGIDVEMKGRPLVTQLGAPIRSMTQGVVTSVRTIGSNSPAPPITSGRVFRADAPGDGYPSRVETQWGGVYPFNGVRSNSGSSYANNGMGYAVVIEVTDPDHPLYRHELRYLHLAIPAENNTLVIEEGQRVQPGQPIGFFGSTDINQSKPHLHFDIMKPRRSRVGGGDAFRNIENFVDPTPWVLNTDNTEQLRSNLDSYYSQSPIPDVGVMVDGGNSPSMNSGGSSYFELNYVAPISRDPAFIAPEVSSRPEPTQLEPSDGLDSQDSVDEIFSQLEESFPRYQEFLQERMAEGWIPYRRDITQYNLFYKEHTYTVSVNSSAPTPEVAKDLGPMVCTHISGNTSNVFRHLPMAGSIYPTAQHLASRDTNLNLMFYSVGLNNLKVLTSIHHTLRKQAKEFKHIPGSWHLKIENNLINSIGTDRFVVSSMDEATVHGNPGLYAIEVRLISTSSQREATRVNFVGIKSTDQIYRSFISELRDLDIIRPISRLEERVGVEDQRSSVYIHEARLAELGINTNPDGATATSVGPVILDPLKKLVAGINLVNNHFVDYRRVADEIPADFTLARFFFDQAANEITSPSSRIPNGPNDLSRGSRLNAFGLEAKGQDLPSLIFRNRVVTGRSGRTEQERNVYLAVDEAEYLYSEGVNITTDSNPGALLKSSDPFSPFRGDSTYSFSEATLEPRFSNRAARSRSALNGGDDLTGVRDDVTVDLLLREATGRSFLGPAPVARSYIEWDPEAAAFARTLSMYIQSRSNRLTFRGRQTALATGAHLLGTRVYRLESLRGRVDRFGRSPTDFILTEIDDWGVPKFFIGSVRNAVANRSLLTPNADSEAPPEFRSQQAFAGMNFVDAHQFFEGVGIDRYILFGDLRERRFRWGSEEIEIPVINNSFLERERAETRRRTASTVAANIPDFESYLWETVCRSILVDAMPNMDEIRAMTELLSPEGFVLFPQTRELMSRDIVRNDAGTYKDIKLPQHPYWNRADGGYVNLNIFTDPDFYLVNYGTETNYESPVSISDSDTPLTPTTMYNIVTQVQAETAILSTIREGEPQEVTPPVADTTVLYRGAPDATVFEYGFGRGWMPDEFNQTMDDAFAQHIQEFIDEDSISTGLVNSSLQPIPGDQVDNLDIYAADLHSRPAGDGGPASSASLDTDIVIGNRRTGNQINFASISPMFGRNPRLKSLPAEIQDQYIGYSSATIWGGQETSPVDVLNALSESTDFERALPYNFNVEPEEGRSSRDSFISGNWGYADVHQWTNGRASLYHKIRSALKSLGKKKLACRRAFPTYKLYFIDEDSIETEWVEYDDFYSYDQIESIQISDSRKRPASLCTISFLNIGGALDGLNMWKAAQTNFSERMPPEEIREQQLLSNVELGGQMSGTETEQNSSAFTLQEGVKIKLKMGYSNNPRRLQDLFIGEVTEIQYQEDGNRISIIAQSYGTELVARAKGVNVRQIKKSYSNTFSLLAHLMFEPEVLHFGRYKRNTYASIFEDQSIRTNEIIYKNGFGSNNKETTGLLNALLFVSGYKVYAASAYAGVGLARRIAGLNPLPERTEEGDYRRTYTQRMIGALGDYFDRSATQTTGTPLVGPQDDNLYPPSFAPSQRYRWYHWFRWKEIEVPASGSPDDGPGETGQGEDGVIQTIVERFSAVELEYNLFYSSIWDVFQEMTLRHPGYIAAPRIYRNSNRMTMFFGLPDQNYWASEPSFGEMARAQTLMSRMLGSSEFGDERTVLSNVSDLNEFMDLSTRRYRPFRDYHQLNSVTDIVQNNIIANKYGFFTNVVVRYVSGSGARARKKAIERIQEYGPAEGNINPNSFARFDEDSNVELRAHRDLSPFNIRTKTYEFANCRGKVFATRYARALLAQNAKEMYKGSLLILGNPDIKPYDVCVINDSFTDMSGPIEVEEVVHMFSPSTGWVTEIIPDTFVVNEDITPFILYNSILPTIMIKTEKYFEGALYAQPDTESEDAFERMAGEELESYRNTRRTMQSAFSILRGFTFAEQLDSLPTVATPFFTIPQMSLSLLVNSIGMYVIRNFVAYQKNFLMVPLIKKGRPWVVGYEMTSTNSYYKGLFDVMRRWWGDGGEGLNLLIADSALDTQRRRNLFAGELTAWSKVVFGTRDLNNSFRRGLLIGGNNIVQPIASEIR